VFADIRYDDGLGYACFDLGACYLALGRDQEALASLRESTHWHAAVGNRNRQAFALLALGDAAERNQWRRKDIGRRCRPRRFSTSSATRPGRRMLVPGPTQIR
jgi:hypothetical protein